MTPRFHYSAAMLAVMLGGALATPSALAQTQPTTPPQTSTPGATVQSETGAPPSQAELKHFAAAAVQVENIKQTLQPKLATAKDDSARNGLKQAAEKQMEAAVRNNELSLHRYIEIANVVQTNSTIRNEVQQLMPPKPSKS